MPRKARRKYPEAIYHIICRSESEFLLFRDSHDKDYFLGLLKRYKDRFKCAVYAYCLMDNHLHLQLDPRGFDVSKFMHCLNTAYVRYYNRRYDRHGHVFQGRFESRILDTDEYNLAVSAYIHNNPRDVEGYLGREEYYRYSSYGIYLGLRKDTLELVDRGFIMELFNIADVESFRERYFGYVSHQRAIRSCRELKEKLSGAIENEYLSGRRIIARDVKPSKVLSYISGRLLGEKGKPIAGGSRRAYEYRAFSAYALRVLCGLRHRDICESLYNITISGCSRLSGRGYELTEDRASVYAGLFEELISRCA